MKSISVTRNLSDFKFVVSFTADEYYFWKINQEIIYPFYK